MTSAVGSSFASWSHYGSSSSRGAGAGPSSAPLGAIGKERADSGGYGSGSYGGGSAPTSFTGGAINKEVLKGLRDVVWSDDEEEQECPLCMEELDPSDVNFKPCVCGYQVSSDCSRCQDASSHPHTSRQICRFCHHQIIHDLNGLCPACRRRYDEQEIQFKPVDPEEMKRLQQAKQLKLKVNRQLEQLGRKHLRDVRVVVKNMVYVVGMRMPAAMGQDEFLSLLRSNDYFGQYGKISKIFIRKPPHDDDDDNANSDLDVGIYISFVRREDAARAISALDGYQAPNNPGKTLQASYGSAKYCISWLRGVKCEDGGVGGGCMGLHEWAAEADTFTRQDMATLQHTIKQTGSGMDAALQQQKERQRLALEQERLRQRAAGGASGGAGSSTPPPAQTSGSTPSRPGLPESNDSNTALPGTARWAARPPPAPAPPAAPATPVQPPAKRRAKVLSLSNMGGKPTLTTLTPSGSSSSSSQPPAAAAPAAATTSTPASSSTPTPSRKTTKPDAADTSDAAPVTPAKTTKSKTTTSSLSRSNSTASSAAPPGLTTSVATPAEPSAASSPETSHSVPQSAATADEAPVAEEPASSAAPTSSTKAPATDDDTTPSMPALVPSTSIEQAAESLSPLPSPLPASPSDHDIQGGAQTAYQPSVQTQALLDEVILRREGLQPDFSVQSPYPDFDDLAESFADGEFSYVLDEKMVLGDEDAQSTYAVLMAQFIGPAVEDLLKKPRVEPAVRSSESNAAGALGGYDGGFDPFIEPKPAPSRDALLLDEHKRKGSRFGFANKTASDMMEKLTGGSLSGKITPMSTGRPQEPEPSYFTNVPGSVPQPARSMTPSSVAMGSPAAAARQRTASISSTNMGQGQMPPPPGLGSFPAYQNANALRSTGMEQQMMSGMHSFQQQFQAEGLRSQSPTINRTANVNAMNSRFGNGGNGEGTFPFQDPAIMAMRMAGAGGPNPMFSQGQSPFDGSGPYSQQGFQDGGISARLLQQMHQGPQQPQQPQQAPPAMPPMNLGRASSPAQQMSNGGRSASRQSYHSGRWF